MVVVKGLYGPWACKYIWDLICSHLPAVVLLRIMNLYMHLCK